MSGHLAAYETLGEAIAAYKARIAELERIVQHLQQRDESPPQGGHGVDDG